jgi:hypothetical protein
VGFFSNHRAIAEPEGLWPGVIGFANDADLWCNKCARRRYGRIAVDAVIHSRKGYERYTDHEGNYLSPILWGSEDARGQYCARCGAALSDDDEDDG